MDCTIPSGSVRTFCASIGCLSKIGKDLYLDFDPLDGLILRTLNDAKSAYCAFDYQPAFFERCTAPPTTSSSRRRRNHERMSNSSSQELRFCIRVPMRALAPVVRPRKGVVALRIRSEGHNNNDNRSSSNNKNASLQLAFEFHMDAGAAVSADGNRQQYNSSNSSSWIKVVHRIGVAEADNVQAVVTKDEASELVASPRVLSKLLEPLKKTAEVALILTKDATTVVATSFHHPTDVPQRNNNNSNTSNALLTANSLLKTETGIAVEDLDEYEFREHRSLSPDENLPLPPHDVNEEVTLVFSIKEAKAVLQFCSLYPPPASVGGGWGGAHHDDNYDDYDQRSTSFHRRHATDNKVALYYHWGGQPLIWESKSAPEHHFKLQLVLATLDHQLLQGPSSSARAAAVAAHDD